MNENRKLRLLLVDDDEEHIDFMSIMLSREAPSLSITAVNSSRECLEYLEQNSADCILSDYQMPDMDGMELLEHLRTRGDSTPFIFHTGQGNEEVARQAFILGASDYFTKDVGFAHYARIINSVEQAVKRRAAETERKLAEDALRNTAEGVSAATGETFFRSLVEYLAKTLEVDYAFIGRLSDEDKARVKTVCVYAQGEFVDNFEYGLAGTPCENVVGKKICYLQKDARKIFPEDMMLAEMGIESYAGSPLFDASGNPIGLLVLLNRSPLTKIELTSSLLKIFASRASSELERMQSVQALRESESKFRGLVEGSNIGVVIVQDGRFAYLNPRYAEILGCTQDELYGRESIYEVIHPDDVPVVRENIRMRMEGEIDSALYHFRMITKDGRVVHVEAHGTRTTYKGRTALVGTIVDVTERKSAEEALREGEHRLRSIMDHLPDPVWLKGKDGSYITVNKAYGEMVGIGKEDIEGRTDHDIWPPDDAEKLKSDDNEIISTGRQKHIEEYVRHTDNRGTWYDTTKRPFYDHNGNIVGTIGISHDINERRNSEEKLRKLSMAVEQSPAIVIITDTSGVIEYVNPRFTEITGIGPEMLVGTNAEELGDQPPEEKRRMMEVIGSGGVWKGEFHNYKEDGELYWVSASISPIRDDTGAVSHFISIQEDITERKKAEEELIARNQELFALNEVAEVIANTPDLDGMLRLVLEKTLSLPVLNVENKGVIFLCDEGDPENLVMAAQAGLSPEHALCEQQIKLGWCLCGIAAMTGETILSDDCFEDRDHVMRYPGMKPHGHVVAPIKTKDKVLGVMTFYVATGEQASPSNIRLIGGVASQLAVAIENHRLFQKIANAKDEWEDTFDAIEDMVTILDGDFSILRANKAATIAAGMDETTIIGKKYQELFKAAGRHIDHSPASSRFEFSEKHAYYEYADEGRHYEASIYPVHQEGGGTAFVHVVKDITEQRKLEEQLRHSQKMEAIGQLAGGVAHDYNNITATIIACANVLQLKLPEDNPLRTYVDQIMSSSDRATRLTKSLLAFGRKQLLSPEQVEVNELIAKTGKLLSRLIGEDIHLNIRLSKNPLTIMADYTQIEQVLMNLSTNARDAMDGGGSITIRTKTVDIEEDFIKSHGYGHLGRFALITFSDTGKGIDKDMLGSIFEPFFTTKDVGKGTGLGLSIVYGIIKQHGGYITVYSEPGNGTEFKIYLPLVAPSHEKPEKKEFIELPGGSETILLAEDDSALRSITKEILEGVGYRVFTAVDGVDALEKFMDNKEDVDLMLLDVVMPKMNGRELYESIIPVRPDVKAIFMSGYTNDIITRKGGIGGSLEFISKPAAPEELLKKIREILDADS